MNPYITFAIMLGILAMDYAAFSIGYSASTSEQKNQPIQIRTDRQTLSNIVFACLYLLSHPDVMTQTVGDEEQEFRITSINQAYADLPYDSAKMECAAFIELTKSDMGA